MDEEVRPRRENGWDQEQQGDCNLTGMLPDIEHRRDDQTCYDNHEEGITDPDLFKERENDDEGEEKCEKEHGFIAAIRFRYFMRLIRGHRLPPNSAGGFYLHDIYAFSLRLRNSKAGSRQVISLKRYFVGTFTRK
jgi:hypothetical protein